MSLLGARLSPLLLFGVFASIIQQVMRSKLLNFAFQSKLFFIIHVPDSLSKEYGAPGHGQAKGTSVSRQKKDMNCPWTMCMDLIGHDLI